MCILLSIWLRFGYGDIFPSNINNYCFATDINKRINKTKNQLNLVVHSRESSTGIFIEKNKGVRSRGISRGIWGKEQRRSQASDEHCKGFFRRVVTRQSIENGRPNQQKTLVSGNQEFSCDEKAPKWKWCHHQYWSWFGKGIYSSIISTFLKWNSFNWRDGIWFAFLLLCR